MSTISNIGGGRVEIGEKELTEFLNTLSPGAQAQAREAINDFEGGRYCAHDQALCLAFCFQRQGTSLLYHFWNDIESQEIAEKLFAQFPPGQLPFTDYIAEQIYRDVTGTEHER